MIHGLSFVSGIAGLDLALRLVYGDHYRTLAYCEIDPFCQDVLIRRMQDGRLDRAPIWPDLCTFDGRPWRGRVDLVHAGLPCQPYSVAGKRIGHDDPRGWGIVKHAVRVIGECRPAVVFLENVPTWVTGGWFRRCGEALSGLGYRVESPFFCRASDVGAPHRRERVFILATLADVPYEASAEIAGSSFGLDDPSGPRRDGREPEPGAATRDEARGREPRGRRDAVGDAPSDHGWAGDSGAQASTRLDGERGWGSASSGDALADPTGPRLEGRLLVGLSGDADGQPPAWPPGPSEWDRWVTVLARWPWLAPALAKPARKQVWATGQPRVDATGKETPQPAVRRVATRLPNRTHRLRVLGNAVVPAQAAYAFVVLMTTALAEPTG